MDPDCRSETTGDHQGGRTIARVGERGLPTSAGHPPPFGEVGGDPTGRVPTHGLLRSSRISGRDYFSSYLGAGHPPPN